jgi:hypothetical protein
MLAMSLGFAMLGGCASHTVQRIDDPVAQSLILQGIALASPVKTHLSVLHAETGKLPEPETFARGAVSGLSVSEGGVITIRYNRDSGVNGGLVVLRPASGNEFIGIDWTCVSPSFSNIADWLPSCRYVRRL